MTNVSEPTQRGQSRKTKGEEIVEGLRELVAALKAGEPLESRFTVRTLQDRSAAGIPRRGRARVRELLAMSQAAFGAFLGADPSTVRSWEQDLRLRVRWRAASYRRSKPTRPTGASGSRLAWSIRRRSAPTSSPRRRPAPPGAADATCRESEIMAKLINDATQGTRMLLAPPRRRRPIDSTGPSPTSA